MDPGISTVGQLKELLAGVPDDYEVFVYGTLDRPNFSGYQCDGGSSFVLSAEIERGWAGTEDDRRIIHLVPFYSVRM